MWNGFYLFPPPFVSAVPPKRSFSRTFRPLSLLSIQVTARGGAPAAASRPRHLPGRRQGVCDWRVSQSERSSQRSAGTKSGMPVTYYLSILLLLMGWKEGKWEGGGSVRYLFLWLWHVGSDGGPPLASAAGTSHRTRGNPFAVGAGSGDAGVDPGIAGWRAAIDAVCAHRLRNSADGRGNGCGDHSQDLGLWRVSLWRPRP